MAASCEVNVNDVTAPHVHGSYSYRILHLLFSCLLLYVAYFFCTLVVLKPLNNDDCDYKTSADSKFRYLFFILFHFYFFL